MFNVRFCYGIGAGHELGYVNRAVATGSHSLGDSVARDRERNAGHNTILTGLDQVHGAERLHLKPKIGADRV